MKRCLSCGSEQQEAQAVCQNCGKPFGEAAGGSNGVRLYDVLVESLDSPVAREHCARTLLKLKRVATLEAALDQLGGLPYRLFTHVPEEEANQYERLLEVSGVEARAQPSLIVCPYCHFSAELEGKLSERRDGVFYRCYSCSRKFFLSYRDHAAHMLLDCSACGTSLRLPVTPRVGRYKCVCGTMLDYLGGGQFATPPRTSRPGRATVQAARKAAAAEAESVLQAAKSRPSRPWRVYGMVLVVLLVVAAIFYFGLTLGRIFFSQAKPSPAPSQPVAVELDPRIEEFTANTTYTEIIATLGAPRREALSPDGKDRLLLYPDHNYYIVVSHQGKTRDLYRGTFRLSDDLDLHSPSPPKP